MPRPEKVDTLDDVKIWIADHDGRIDEYWRVQHLWNERVENKFDRINQRISILEKRIIFVAGIAAAFGSAAGAGIFQLFT